ncbi:MAG: response regulator, partial [Chloroflexota bacterium]
MIDDEPGIVDVLEMGLRLQGFTVESAADVASGIQLVRQLRPDLVILDVGLPDGSGLDLLRRIRAESPVPIVMLTAREDVDDRV